MTAKKWTKSNELKLQGPPTICLPTKHAERIRIISLETSVRKHDKFNIACFMCWIRMQRKVPTMYQEGAELGCGEKCQLCTRKGWGNRVEAPALLECRVLPSVPQQFPAFQFMLHIKSFLITTFEIKETDGLAACYQTGDICCTEPTNTYFLLKRCGSSHFIDNNSM